MQISDSFSYSFFASGILTILFLWAGCAKMASFESTKEDFKSLKLPSDSAFVSSVIGGEFALAVLLQTHRLYGSSLAVLTLSAYTTIIVTAVRSPEATTCSCFGSFRKKQEVSYLTILRNILLLSIALFSVYHA